MTQSATKKYWLVTILVETADDTCDDHALYASEADAKRRMDHEIATMANRFDLADGDTLIDLPNIVQWNDQDGHGFTIGYCDIALS